MESILNEYFNVLTANADRELIDAFEEKIGSDFQTICNSRNFNSFFNLPFQSIRSIISKVDFSLIENNYFFIHQIIENVMKQFPQEGILILNDIQCSRCNFSLENYISFIGILKNSDICNCISNLYHARSFEVEIDYDFELDRKNQEISSLKNKINELEKVPTKTITVPHKPKGFISNIHEAALKGNFPSVQYLIETEKIDPNIKDENYSTPLHCACITGRIQITKYLIDQQNADFEARDNHGRTPLHFACLYNRLPIVQYLTTTKHANIETLDSDGYNPLHIACARGHLQIVIYLIEKAGANKEGQTLAGETPLHIATRNNQLNVMKYLIENANCNLYAVTKNQESLLAIAMSNRRTQIVKYILSVQEKKST